MDLSECFRGRSGGGWGWVGVRFTATAGWQGTVGMALLLHYDLSIQLTEAS